MLSHRREIRDVQSDYCIIARIFLTFVIRIISVYSVIGRCLVSISIFIGLHCRFNLSPSLMTHTLCDRTGVADLFLSLLMNNVLSSACLALDKTIMKPVGDQ